MSRIHLLMDGNNTAYRSNCVTEMYTKHGERTSAIVGVLNITHATVEALSQDLNMPICEIIYVFDKGHSQRRTTLYPEYKAHRKERTEEDNIWMDEFITQLNVLHQALPVFGVKSVRIDGWEADDLIYGFSRELAEHEPDDVSLVVSTDEDFHQLISDCTWVYNPIKQVLYTPLNYEQLTGMKPEMFLSYKILRGDTSDNISGIAGIGEVNAKKLVNQYGDLGGILAAKDELIKSKRTAKIFTPEGLATLDRNNQLINLADYVDLSDVTDEIEETLNEVPFLDSKLAKQFLMRYQVVSLLAKWNTWSRLFEQVAVNYSDA